MDTRSTLRAIVLNNALWFAGSLTLAFLVWLIAVVQSDPVAQLSLADRIPIRVTADPALIVTNMSELPTTASLTVRGPGSIVTAMTADDVSLAVDLTGYAPGSYAIPLEAVIAPEKRASVVRITPRLWNVRLETRLTQLKPVRADITGAPAAVYAVGAPEIDLLQTEVTGPESRVSRVVEVVARVSLADQRSSYDGDVALFAVDVDGAVVMGVTVERATARVRIDIQQRNDVAEVRVQPNIVGELPPGYILTPDFDYSPQTVIVRGTRAVLDALPGTFFTERIDLSDHTNSFEVTIPIELPDPRLLVVTGGSVTVRVGIAAQQVTRQFDRVPVTLIGEQAGLRYTLTPNEVTVLVTGPQPLLDRLLARDLGALVEVSGLRAGESGQIAPVPSMGQDNGDISASVLPALVDVIVDVEATAEATAEGE